MYSRPFCSNQLLSSSTIQQLLLPWATSTTTTTTTTFRITKPSTTMRYFTTVASTTSSFGTHHDPSSYCNHFNHKRNMVFMSTAAVPVVRHPVAGFGPRPGAGAAVGPTITSTSSSTFSSAPTASPASASLTTTTTSPSVLIVGGGLAGLSAALFFAWRGIPVTLIEKHLTSSIHPRAIGFTTRTMELFRVVGIEGSIPQVAKGHQVRPRRIRVESLAGQWFNEVEWTPPSSSSENTITTTTKQVQQQVSNDPENQNDHLKTKINHDTSRPQPRNTVSPCTGAAIAQDQLENIIRQKAMELGADIRMGMELISFQQDDLGVHAVVRRRHNTISNNDNNEQDNNNNIQDSEYKISTQYLIAADGHKSPIRIQLDIGRTGHGFIRVMRSIIFRADLDEYLESGFSQFELNQPDFKGMLTTYRDGRWLLMFSDDTERNEDILHEQVQRAIGRTDRPIELITTGRWVLSALIANKFSNGRVFLVGDAAHTLPPSRGGYGANTGIEDAFNIAWKLASVLSGTSTPQLLDTYDAERRPIAWLRHNQIFTRPDYAAVASDEEKKVPMIDDEAMELGQLYRSQCILGADNDIPPAQCPNQWRGQPGTRAPHLWIANSSKENEYCSTIDILHDSWTLLSADPECCTAALEAAIQLDIKLQLMPVDCKNEMILEAFGISSSGCSLIRPDGYVAWRSIDKPNDGELSSMFYRVLTKVACC